MLPFDSNIEVLVENIDRIVTCVLVMNGIILVCGDVNGGILVSKTLVDPIKGSECYSRISYHQESVNDMIEFERGYFISCSDDSKIACFRIKESDDEERGNVEDEGGNDEADQFVKGALVKEFLFNSSEVYRLRKIDESKFISMNSDGELLVISFDKNIIIRSIKLSDDIYDIEWYTEIILSKTQEYLFMNTKSGRILSVEYNSGKIVKEYYPHETIYKHKFGRIIYSIDTYIPYFTIPASRFVRTMGNAVEVIVCAGSDGMMLFVDIRSGKLLRKIQMFTHIWSVCAINNSYVVTGNARGEFSVLGCEVKEFGRNYVNHHSSVSISIPSDGESFSPCDDVAVLYNKKVGLGCLTKLIPFEISQDGQVAKIICCSDQGVVTKVELAGLKPHRMANLEQRKIEFMDFLDRRSYLFLNHELKWLDFVILIREGNEVVEMNIFKTFIL